MMSFFDYSSTQAGKPLMHSGYKAVAMMLLLVIPCQVLYNNWRMTGIYKSFHQRELSGSESTDELEKGGGAPYYHDVLEELDVLSGGHSHDDLNCPHPLIPFRNRIVRPTNETDHGQQPRQMIPRILHVSMKSRCMTRDHFMYMKRWMDKLPNYSIFFHDDEAVARLIGQDWPEFPDLHKAMKCVLYKGAMTVDVWRVLVLYKYGGIYTDIDNWPEDKFTEDMIPADVSAFFFSDSWTRPSQWFMTSEPRHPMMYLSMMEITRNILKMDDIMKPRVVFVTGPHATGQGYYNFLAPTCCNGTTSKEEVFKSDVVVKGLLEKRVLKATNKGFLRPKKYYDDIVPYNATLNVTRGERISMDSGVVHWAKRVHRGQQELRATKMPKTCQGYLDAISAGETMEVEGLS